jgi:restriction endonuclease S subunit
MTATVLNRAFEVITQERDITSLRKLIVVSAIQLSGNGGYVNLGKIAEIEKGKTGIKDAKSGSFPLVVTAEARASSDHFDFEGPSTLIPMVSSTGHGDASLKRIHYQDGQYAVGTILAVVSVRDKNLYSDRFVYEYLSAFKDEQLVSRMVGTANVSLTIGKLNDVAIPALPIDAQRNVERLMQSCDQLESELKLASALHQELVQALLDSLTPASGAEDFAPSWQRLSEHFDTLFTTEASIDALKQTLLQLAVMGKLVPQDPDDEPASELLKRITSKKAGRHIEDKTKTSVDQHVILEEETGLPLEAGWSLTRLDVIARVGTGATPLRSNKLYFNPGTYAWVTSGETSRSFIEKTEFRVSPKALAETNLTVYPPHTLVVAMYGQGKTRGQISELLIDACTNQACAAIQLIEEDASHRKYVKYFFVKIYDEIRLLAAGGAQPNLNLGKIKETAIPLPPLAEQRRIVAKVDELMSLCDELKSRISQARDLNQQLASTLVECAIA